MSEAFTIRISSGKSWKDESRFVSPPEIVASVSGHGMTTYACISQQLTRDTGTNLRALADEADALWAEFVKHRQALISSTSEVAP